MTQLDPIDRRLLDELQRDSRQTHKDLAGQVGLAPATVYERIKKLERAGVIRGYRALVDPLALGLGVTAFVSVWLEGGQHCRDLDAALAVFPEIEEMHSVAGEADLLLKIKVATTADIEELNFRLKRLAGVWRTSTVVVLSTRFEARPHLSPDPAL